MQRGASADAAAARYQDVQNADSVRRDLVRMPDMSAAELRSAMAAHGARVMRLMQMHRSMIGDMKK